MIKPYQRTALALDELLDRSQPGEVLPSEPKLAEQLGVSRATLREAMRALEDRGRIVRRQGVGTYVRPTIIEAGLEELVSIESMAASVGLDVEMGDSEIHRRNANPDEAELLGVDKVVEIRRVILAEGVPVAYLVDTIGEGLIQEAVLSREFHGSVLDVLLKGGEPELEYSTSEISAVSAEGRVADRLRVSEGSVLLQFEASLFTKDGELVDLSQSYFLPGTFKFHVVRRVGRRLGTAA
ncbi:MAG: GntR family transcriptional regulator [Chloroflexi bacterium]|nr:GntR family transcriptional regulator [Chloroflexota bacterium]